MDRFRVEVISQTPEPQRVVYAAMHQDYSEGFVVDERSTWPEETRAGEVVVKRLLAGERGHYGPLEHPQLVLNVGFFPHSVLQQARTHRVGVSFDVQCLAGDTEVTFVQASGSLLQYKISELADLWHNGECAVRERKIQGRNGESPGKYRRDCKKRLRKMQLRVLNEETKIFEIGHINEVFSQGTQPVYRLTLEDGRTLDCTEKHQLLTESGWKTMEDALELRLNDDRQVLNFNQNCLLMTNGVVVGAGLYRDKAWLQEKISAGLTSIAMAKEAGCSVEAVNKWVHLERQLKAHPMKVVQVKYLGYQPTYDLAVEGPWHNFVGNGVVVHNSMRYTGTRVAEVAQGLRDVEEIFYLRPIGNYSDRQGKKYEYTEAQRRSDLAWCLEAAKRYQADIEAGWSEEHARGKLPFDYRQHFVVSFNLRSLMHFLDLRYKLDAQLEIQMLCELIYPHFEAWVPEIAAWYGKTRKQKGRLAP
jgi:thymidylate synthase (FAD)